MTWEKSTSHGVPIVEWVGLMPEFVYHFTSREALRRIRKEKVLQAGDAGRAGLSATGSREGGVSFTDDVSSFISKHGLILSQFIRVNTSYIPALAPVVYVGGKNPIQQHIEMARLREIGAETRSMHFVKEKEWWTPNDVPLKKGTYSIALPLTDDKERSL